MVGNKCLYHSFYLIFLLNCICILIPKPKKTFKYLSNLVFCSKRIIWIQVVAPLQLCLCLFLKGLQMLDPESFWVWTSGIQMWLQQRDKLWISCSALTSEFVPELPKYNMQGCLTLALLVVGHTFHSSQWNTVWICPKNYTSH